MITNTGKNIIGKYLLGQVPAYASYIAVGCGPKPLQTSDPVGDYSAKTNLDFEMFRIPITSRGIINENDVSKIVLTAELPTEERYEITEVGIYSAGSNPSARSYDSKTILAFSATENWQRHTSTASTTIPTVSAALDSPNDDNIIAVTDPVFKTNADNNIFYKTTRAQRYERSRFLNNTVVIRGDESTLTSGAHLTIGNGSNHIHITGTTVDLNKNSPIDELRLAFSVLNKDGDSLTVPDSAKILLEFASTDSNSAEYARFEVDLTDLVDGVDFASNRYYTVKKQLQELYRSANFTWDIVTTIKIYASVYKDDAPSDDYYIAMDALRLENVATVNPLYGLVGYSIIRNDSEETIIKAPNSSNYLEFRFVVGVS